MDKENSEEDDQDWSGDQVQAENDGWSSDEDDYARERTRKPKKKDSGRYDQGNVNDFGTQVW